MLRDFYSRPRKILDTEITRYIYKVTAWSIDRLLHQILRTLIGQDPNPVYNEKSEYIKIVGTSDLT